MHPGPWTRRHGCRAKFRPTLQRFGPPTRARSPYTGGVPTLLRPPGPPRGTVLAEVVVAATVLTVGVLGTAGVLAVAARDARRARARHAGVALLTARIERWRAAPCTPALGEQQTGALLERWRGTRAGALATLADTVALDATSAQRVGVVAVAWCAP